MIEEIWKDITGFEGLYQVSNFGRIKSLDRKIKYKDGRTRVFLSKILKTGNNGHGYLIVNLSKNGKTKMFYVHRLVAETFIPNPNNLPQVNHKDENTYNNYLNNLEFCTSNYNANYGRRNEKFTQTKIEKYGKRVEQYDLNGVFIKLFKSISLASKEMKCCPEAISNCCKGKSKTSCGYIWRYADE